MINHIRRCGRWTGITFNTPIETLYWNSSPKEESFTSSYIQFYKIVTQTKQEYLNHITANSPTGDNILITSQPIVRLEIKSRRNLQDVLTLSRSWLLPCSPKLWEKFEKLSNFEKNYLYQKSLKPMFGLIFAT